MNEERMPVSPSQASSVLGARFTEKPFVKNILFALGIMLIAFAVLNASFMIMGLTARLFDLFLPANFAATSSWFMPVLMTVFAFAVAVLSWFVFKSELPDILKAGYSVLPIAFLYLAIGVPLYRWRAISLGINALVFAGLLTYLYKAKTTWFYYYALILISSALLIITLSGTDI